MYKGYVPFINNKEFENIYQCIDDLYLKTKLNEEYSITLFRLSVYDIYNLIYIT